MTGDTQGARDELAAEADRLAAKRAADTEAKQQATARDIAERTQRARIVHPAYLRASLFRGLYLIIGVTLLVIVPGFLFVAANPETDDEHEVGKLTRNEVIIAAGLGAAGIALVALRLTSIGRSRRWRATLPFAIKGYEETLGLPVCISQALVTVVPRGTQIEYGVLAELVRARIPGCGIQYTGDVMEIRCEWPAATEVNLRVADWFHRLVRTLLLDVHRGYPIESVTLAASATRGFEVTGGD